MITQWIEEPRGSGSPYALVEVTEPDLSQKIRHILARFRLDGRTPMMRFVFLGWTHADYEALDRRFAGVAVPTRRYILPDDEGILVGSEAERFGRTSGRSDCSRCSLEITEVQNERDKQP
jgi:hypothetical protein